MNPISEVPLIKIASAPKASQREIRLRWPRGPVGQLAYLWDHKLYRFDWPVDWVGAYFAEESMFPWNPNGSPNRCRTTNQPLPNDDHQASV